ncbi:MAG: flagellar filament capping protein FliD, partial [Mariprofundales bacterium]|nr:flagellar filament capping protein FliD [Mariprofundales bacterium]
MVSNQLAGFDTVAAVKGILTPQQNEIDQLTKRQTDIVAKQDLLNAFNADLQTLRSTATAMADSASFFSYGATLSSSNSSVSASSLLAVSGTNSVSAGSHSLVVDQVAAAKRTSSSAAVQTATNTAITADTDILGLTASSFQINGATVNVTSADSLLDIKNSINQLNTGSTATGVTASIVKINNSDFRLVLASDNTGAGGFSLAGSALNSGGNLANLHLGTQASSTAVQDSTTTAITSSTTPLNISGTFEVTAGSSGTPTSITVATTDSLQDVATKISAVAGVVATVDTVGSSDLRLSIGIDSSNPPVDNTITIGDASGTAIGAGKTLAGLQLTLGSVTNVTSIVQPPLDAKVTVDGLQITRSSNSISDALSGVTLDLKQADPTTTISMNIAIDTAALQSSVQTFIDGYNTVMSFINSQYAIDPKTGTNGILASDPLLGTIQHSLVNTILQTVSGLPSDRNSLALIGIEPDSNGVLSINPALFDNFLNTNPTAIRDLFVATGTTDNNQLQFLTNGFTTPSGSYSVDITQAATRSIANSTTPPTASTDTLTITEGARVATLNLGTTTNISTLINDINTEFAKTTTEQRRLDAALNGGAANTATTLSSLGFAVNDTITIGGTSRVGTSIKDSVFTVLSTTDTLGDLLSAIQVAFDQQVVASIDSGGHIAIADATAGDSLLGLTLTPSSAVNLGVDTVVTEGRYAMNLQAIEDPTTPGAIAIRAKSYGSSTSFSINSTTNKLGLNSYTAGVDVSGTINGNSATGTGQLLSGTSGNIDGMGLLFTGSSPTTATLTLGVGTAASYDGLLDTFSNNFTGLIASDIQFMQTNYDNLTTQISNLQTQMDLKRTQLTQSFSQMQQILSSLQSTGSFLT